jgi:hypothetical protein
MEHPDTNQKRCVRLRLLSMVRHADGIICRRAEWVAALELSAALPKTSYNDYLHIDPLLALQTPHSHIAGGDSLESHDEMLFIVVHQVLRPARD